MGFRLSERNRKGLWVMLAVDVVALLVAVYRQYSKLPWTPGKVIADRSAPICWALFAILVGLTLIYILLSREEESVIRGLPDSETSEPDDTGRDSGGRRGN